MRKAGKKVLVLFPKQNLLQLFLLVFLKPHVLVSGWLNWVLTQVSVYVDSNKLNAVDDNLAGWLKKSWSMTYRWIPSDWATLDGESPDVWAEKNRNEGVMLGFTSSGLEASVKLFRAIRGTRSVTDYVFKDESAAKAFARAEEADPKAFMENMEAAVAKTEEALDEIGELALSKNPAPEEATKGVHDVFILMRLVHVP